MISCIISAYSFPGSLFCCTSVLSVGPGLPLGELTTSIAGPMTSSPSLLAEQQLFTSGLQSKC
jgi:hypothetical protein